MHRIMHAEAVPSGWHARHPPVDGWTPVKLMDTWTSRWPAHNGVVWYRMHWRQTAPKRRGLLLEYICLAYAVYVNGSLIHRDRHLVEPLSRSWVSPQYMVIPKPLTHAGRNTLLVRVSGLAAYAPGLGPVVVGNPNAVWQLYKNGHFWRHDIQLLDVAIGLVLGALFLILWLLRRKDTVFGWFALTTLLFVGYEWNYLAATPWPLNDTDLWEAVNAVFYVAAAATFVLFIRRFCQRPRHRLEGLLTVLVMGTVLPAVIAPNWMGPLRGWWILAGTVVYYTAFIAFIAHAARRRSTEQLVLAACLLLQMGTSIHDILLYYGLIGGDTYLLAATAPLTLIGMGFVLAHRFARAMRRAERFNDELQHEIDAATTRLHRTMAHQQELALANTRIGARLDLVRDVHDGFGGSLVSAINRLEKTPGKANVLDTLKTLRDDLRLVIDTTTHEHDTDLAGLIAALRHRSCQRLEAAGIGSSWQLTGLDGRHLGARPSLDVLRFIQEALTNVLKHSAAQHVSVAIRAETERLTVAIHDDGKGFDPAEAYEQGAGLTSLRSRATRLTAEFDIDSVSGAGTRLTLVAPLDRHTA